MDHAPKQDQEAAARGARPITTLALDVVLGGLRDDEAGTLRLIDEDELLKRRERDDGLVIANAGPALFEPTHEHQLLAKGIVYTRDPYRLVSLPLVKMFNHGLREHSDRTSREILAGGRASFVFPEKLDGTMNQMYTHRDGVLFTTRSVLEGTDEREEGLYVELAREVLSRQTPALLDGRATRGLSLIFELIHPKTRQVTNYGAEERMVLLSIFDLSEVVYWSTARTIAWAREHALPHPKLLVDAPDFEAGIARLHTMLEQDPDVPEGSIVCFERDGRILHRVKVKTAEYLRHFALRRQVTIKSVTELLWRSPELHDWESFITYLSEEGLSEEEVEAFYREYFDAFMRWLREVEQTHRDVAAILDGWFEEHGPCPDEREGSRAWFKALALEMKTREPERFPLIMNWARHGGVTVEQMMWHDPLYPGMRELLQREGETSAEEHA